MAIDLENVSAVPSTFAGPGETKRKGCAAVTHEVRAYAATCIANAYRFNQVPGCIHPVPTVLGNTQDAYMDAIPDQAKIAVDSIGPVGTAMTQLDAIDTAYLQTLSTFSTIVNCIIGVCQPQWQMVNLD